MDDFGLGWNDYGARYYDSSIGRWMGVDKMAEHPNQADKSPFAGMWNNPIRYTDPDGNCPWCVVWALAEIGMAIYDAYDAGSTLIDPNASNGQKAMAAGGFLIGAVLPGGGYGTAGKKGLKIVDNYADDVVKKALKETGSAKKAAMSDIAEETGEGVIYKVPGKDTPTGNPYVGSADNLGKRTKTAKDGRDRTNAEVIGHYEKGNKTSRKVAEQKGINDNGGVKNLDNKRNEIKKSNWDKYGVD